MDKEKIRKNIDSIKRELPSNVKLLAVTKSVDVETIKFLKTCGVNDFGENRINVAEQKIKEIDANWNMIGHLQSNKVKKAVELFSMIQSVDSISLAINIDRECEKQHKIMPILIEINISEEAQKSGFNKENVENALAEISKLRNVKLDGFMMMAPHIEPEKTRVYFKEIKKLFDKYKAKYNLKILSMGMSNDYKVAVEEGSTMVRIGTKLFE